MADWSELYPEFKTVMYGDIDVPLSLRFRMRDLPPITATEVIVHSQPAIAPTPRPAVTAWLGADIDAYHCEGTDGLWRHCQTGALWVGDSVARAA